MRFRIVRHDYAAPTSPSRHNEGAISVSAGSNPPVKRKPTMTRISSLVLATGLAILPIGAFAQPNAAPVIAPMAQSAPQASKTPSNTVKTTVSTKDAQPTHAKTGTTTPAAPAKTAEPSKS
jgi:hypothetical protein